MHSMQLDLSLRLSATEKAVRSIRQAKLGVLFSIESGELCSIFASLHAHAFDVRALLKLSHGDMHRHIADDMSQ